MKGLKACSEFYCCECPYNYLDNKEYSLRCIHTLIEDVYKLLKDDLEVMTIKEAEKKFGIRIIRD